MNLVSKTHFNLNRRQIRELEEAVDYSAEPFMARPISNHGESGVEGYIEVDRDSPEVGPVADQIRYDMGFYHPGSEEVALSIRGVVRRNENAELYNFIERLDHGR